VTGFSVRAQRSGLGTTVLELTGDLDLATAPEMFRAGTGSLDDPNCIALIIDVAA
jgi:anti-anti-sigma regulatory factor